MAQFQEVCRQWRRMCREGSVEYSCCNCKMYSELDESICRGIPDEDEAKTVEKYVMAWAAEHPEPVYPTWFEYLYAISNPDYFDLTEFYTWMRHTPIPADIAQKLGIEPKEG